MTVWRSCPDPECGLDAELLDSWVWASTDGDITHYEQRCPAGHFYSGLTDH